MARETRGVLKSFTTHYTADGASLVLSFSHNLPIKTSTDLVKNQVPDFYLSHQWPPLREHGVRQRTKRKPPRRGMPCAVPPLFPTCVHGFTQSVHMSSAKIRGKTSAEAGVQRISPPTICQKSFLSVTAEKLRVNSLLIEKNIGFVKSQTPQWSAGPFSTCAEPNTCTPCLFTFFSPFSGDRGSKVRKTN